MQSGLHLLATQSQTGCSGAEVSAAASGHHGVRTHRGRLHGSDLDACHGLSLSYVIHRDLTSCPAWHHHRVLAGAAYPHYRTTLVGNYCSRDEAVANNDDPSVMGIDVSLANAGGALTSSPC